MRYEYKVTLLLDPRIPFNNVGCVLRTISILWLAEPTLRKAHFLVCYPFEVLYGGFCPPNNGRNYNQAQLFMEASYESARDTNRYSRT